MEDSSPTVQAVLARAFEIFKERGGAKGAYSDSCRVCAEGAVGLAALELLGRITPERYFTLGPVERYQDGVAITDGLSSEVGGEAVRRVRDLAREIIADAENVEPLTCIPNGFRRDSIKGDRNPTSTLNDFCGEEAALQLLETAKGE